MRQLDNGSQVERDLQDPDCYLFFLFWSVVFLFSTREKKLRGRKEKKESSLDSVTLDSEMY
jgi:hypothetical protein